jgi:hypothetical protein
VEQDLARANQSQERLKAFILKEVKDEIKMLNKLKKSPGLDLIAAIILQELPKEGPVNLMYIFTAILRLQYWPKSLKMAQIIMIPKRGKNPMDFPSYRPIRLLPTISKVLEKFILKKKKKLNKDLNSQNWIPNHQFGSRQARSTVQQCNITDGINKAMENQQYCKVAILDMRQAFYKV